MMRTLLTAYFALATLTGPWLCCCLAKGQVCASAPATPIKKCCCCPEATESESQSSIPQQHEKPCPCRAAQKPPAVILRATDSGVIKLIYCVSELWAVFDSDVFSANPLTELHDLRNHARLCNEILAMHSRWNC